MISRALNYVLNGGIPFLEFETYPKKKNSDLLLEAGVNIVSVRRTSLATPMGSGVRCKTTSPFARSGHFMSRLVVFTS